MGALSAHVRQAWMGTTVTCPTLRYAPAVVAEAFASLSQLSPGRIFLGVGSGEALNEEAATGTWPKWQERWDRLIEAIGIIRALWSGDAMSHKGKYYSVEAKLYDPPQHPIPLLTAANGRKSMRLAGQYGDGLITDPLTWKQHKADGRRVRTPRERTPMTCKSWWNNMSWSEGTPRRERPLSYGASDRKRSNLCITCGIPLKFSAGRMPEHR
jgi:G6PDH family F420-dependent oxidoreductase